MIYEHQHFLELETMSQPEIRQALDMAKENYDYIQSLYAEDNDTNPFDTDKLPMDIIFKHLKNIEGYIRKAENLVNEYEIDRSFVRQAIKRRNKRLSARNLDI